MTPPGPVAGFSPTRLPAKRRLRLLTIAPGAGFTFETALALKGLDDCCDLYFLITEHGGEPGRDALPSGRSIPVRSFATMTEPSVVESVRAFVEAFWTTLTVIRRHRIDRVIAVGASHAVPMFLAARLLGRPTTFVESITRVDRLSSTGRLVRRLSLASHFIVQWPALQSRHPGAELGTIL